MNSCEVAATQRPVAASSAAQARAGGLSRIRPHRCRELCPCPLDVVSEVDKHELTNAGHGNRELEPVRLQGCRRHFELDARVTRRHQRFQVKQSSTSCAAGGCARHRHACWMRLSRKELAGARQKVTIKQGIEQKLPEAGGGAEDAQRGRTQINGDKLRVSGRRDDCRKQELLSKTISSCRCSSTLRDEGIGLKSLPQPLWKGSTGGGLQLWEGPLWEGLSPIQPRNRRQVGFASSPLARCSSHDDAPERMPCGFRSVDDRRNTAGSGGSAPRPG